MTSSSHNERPFANINEPINKIQLSWKIQRETGFGIKGSKVMTLSASRGKQNMARVFLLTFSVNNVSSFELL